MTRRALVEQDVADQPRVEDRFILLDCRTVTDEQLPHLARAVHYALEGDEEHGHDVHGDDRHQGPGDSVADHDVNE